MTDIILAFLIFLAKAAIVIASAFFIACLFAMLCYLIAITWKLVNGRFK